MPALEYKEYLDIFYNPFREKDRQKIFGDSYLTERLFKKTDMLSSDTNVRQVTYGAAVMSWINYNTEVWSIFRKQPPGDRHGYVVITGANSSGTANTEASGLQETANFMAASVATFTRIRYGMKWMDTAFAWTEKTRYQQDMDDAINYIENMRDHKGKNHVKSIDSILARPVNWTTGATYVIEALDRMISSSSEATFLSASGDPGSTTGLSGATAADIYPYDVRLRRSGFAGTTYGNGPFDAVVDENAGTLRAFDLTLLDGVIREVFQRGATREGLVILTGNDTADAISQKLEARERFVDKTRIVRTINGVSRDSPTAVDGGVDVIAYKGIPILTSRAVQNQLKPTGGLTAIYGIHIPDAYIVVGRPTTYLQTTEADFLLMDKLRYKAAYVTAAELVFTNPTTHFKIRDLSA